MATVVATVVPLPELQRSQPLAHNSKPKMATGVIGTALPKIAPPSTPIHMNKSPSPTRNMSSTTIAVNRNKSAPANMKSNTLLSSSDYGSHVAFRPNANYTVYPPFVGERQTGVKIPPRVNPLQPPPPQRMHTSVETVNPHWHNEQRRNVMQQREWYRYHGTWSKAFYGSPAEKEAYKKKTRDTLKQQMTDYWAKKRLDFKTGTNESIVSIDYDRQCLIQDAEDRMNKKIYLMQYRDDNKTLMERSWDRRTHQRRLEDEYEGEVIRYTPINWSHTLK